MGGWLRDEGRTCLQRAGVRRPRLVEWLLGRVGIVVPARKRENKLPSSLTGFCKLVGSQRFKVFLSRGAVAGGVVCFFAGMGWVDQACKVIAEREAARGVLIFEQVLALGRVFEAGHL